MANSYLSFKSIEEFLKYIEITPVNKIFEHRNLSSVSGDREFTATSNFDEAKELLKNGWDYMAKELENTMIKIKLNKVDTKMVKQAKFDVVGFQASVPRYLQGLPTNMINQKQIIQKQKVVTIVKHIGYRGDVEQSTIIENSIKALQIVKEIENKGIRVNLDVISPASASDGETCVCRVRIKSANERLNISKIAFPLAHPSMLRRLIFRFREVNPDIKSEVWTSIYDKEKIKEFLNKGEYYLHNFIGDVETEIKKMKIF